MKIIRPSTSSLRGLSDRPLAKLRTSAGVVPHGPVQVPSAPQRVGREPRVDAFLRLFPGIEAALSEGRRYCHRGHRGVTRALQRLDARSLQQLRTRLQGMLEPTLRAATKRDDAFAGRPNVPKVLRLLSGEVWRSKLDWSAKQFQRGLRDQNVDSLMGRHALSLVHGKGGLFSQFNPGDQAHPEGFELALASPGARAGGRVQGPIEQRYALLEASVDLFRVGFNETEIRGFGEESARAIAAERSWSPEQQAERTLRHFLGQAGLRIARRLRHFAELPRPDNLGLAQAQAAAERLSRVRWIEEHVPPGAQGQRLRGGPELYRDDLARLFHLSTAEEIFEAIDHRFEAAMSAALTRGRTAPALANFQTVRFERVRPERVAPGREARLAAQTQGPEDLNHQRLNQLRARLEAGEVSAIGGKDYATQTFPEDLLQQVALGQVTVLAYDGSAEEALVYARERFDRQEGSVRTMGLQGLYGSYPRTLLTFEDGSHVLVLAGFGKSRQLNNAASMLLAHAEDGARVPAERLVLASSTRDLGERFRTEITQAVGREFGVHGGRLPFGVEAQLADQVPTRLLIVQNPAHLEQAYQGHFQWGADPGPTAIPFRIGYLEHGPGRVERVIVPKVGGGGLYGDNAGKFVEAFFESGLRQLSPDVIFSGTAGGFTGTLDTSAFRESRGLPKIEPGGIILPQEGIGEFEHDQLLPMKSLFQRGAPELKQAIAESGAHLTGRHVAVPAPAIETYPLIGALVARGFASVDVEGAEILKAIHRLQDRRPELTFTPVYHHSDDPRASEADRYQSLAMTGPFFEGAHFPTQLYGLITALVRHSAGRVA